MGGGAGGGAERASPDGTFLIQLTRDRDKEENFPYDVSPDVQIVTSDGGKVLATFPFKGDPNSDLRPFRDRMRVHWNAEGSAVALSFSERFYSYLLVYRLKGSSSEPEAFTEVTLPETVPVVRAMIPRFKEFRSRWHIGFQGWPGRNTIQFSAGTGVILQDMSPDDPDVPSVFSFTVDISHAKTPIIKRVEPRMED